MTAKKTTSGTSEPLAKVEEIATIHEPVEATEGQFSNEDIGAGFQDFTSRAGITQPMQISSDIPPDQFGLEIQALKMRVAELEDALRLQVLAIEPASEEPDYLEVHDPRFEPGARLNKIETFLTRHFGNQFD